MKKTVYIVASLMLLCIILIWNGPILRQPSTRGNVSNIVYSENEEDVQKSISSKLIRFHVIANSDTKEDQNLKLKIRDKVLQYMTPKLKDSKSLEESREIIKENDKTIKEIAQGLIKEEGFNYNISTMLSFENFPVKSYGNIILPQGRYEAYRILIGNSRGQNWWCVMFPPLCFVDLAKGEIAEKETEAAMKKVLNRNEYATVNNKVDTKDIVVKSKVVEIAKELKNRISLGKNKK
jgi:stage II sporulation protein R